MINDEALDDLMSFDNVVHVDREGNVTVVDYVIPPDLYEGELESLPIYKWRLMKGYSAQHSYSGPIMHISERIRGKMAKDIFANCGYYVALIDFSAETDLAEGWAVATMPCPRCENITH